MQGEQVFQSLLHAGKHRGIKIKIAQNAPTQDQPNTDTEFLVRRKAAEVRSLNFAQLLGGGVLHTKLWIIDRTHFYVGSANMDWRSLTQVSFLLFNLYYPILKNTSFMLFKLIKLILKCVCVSMQQIL